MRKVVLEIIEDPGGSCLYSDLFHPLSDSITGKSFPGYFHFDHKINKKSKSRSMEASL